MSLRNVEVVRRWFDLYNRRDTEGFVGLNTPDCAMRSVDFAEIDEAYEHYELAAHEFIDAGAAVVVGLEVDWRGKAVEGEGRSPLFGVFWLSAGKVCRYEGFADRREAFEAVELRE